MNVPYLHFWHVIYSNSEAVLVSILLHPPSVTGSGRESEEDYLENNLVFEATVEVFVWEDNRVEYNHLGGDVYVTTWGEKARLYLVCVGAVQCRGHKTLYSWHVGCDAFYISGKGSKPKQEFLTWLNRLTEHDSRNINYQRSSGIGCTAFTGYLYQCSAKTSK